MSDNKYDGQVYGGVGAAVVGAAMLWHNREGYMPTNAAGWAGAGLVLAGGFVAMRAVGMRAGARVAAVAGGAAGDALGGGSQGRVSGSAPPVLTLGGG